MIYSVEEIKKLIFPILSKYKIKKAYLFGSYAKGSATEDSDVDIIVDTENSEINGLFSLACLHLDLETALNKKTDILTLRSFEDIKDESDEIFNKKVNTEKRLIYEGTRLQHIVAN